MEPVTIYYCVKGAVSIGKFALDFYKAQSLNNENLKLQGIKNLNESITDYIGLIRQDILSMMHMYFKSAYENLDYAINASPGCKREYIIQARNRFIDACVIEKNENLILSYLGLSLCQKMLGDSDNSLISLNKIKSVEWMDIYGNDADNLLKYWDPTWWHILFEIQIKRIINYYSPYSSYKPNVSDIIKNEIQSRYDSTIRDTLKQIYLRRFAAIRNCGGFSLNENEFKTTCINAEKLILKEDFYRLKQAVIDAFNL